MSFRNPMFQRPGAELKRPSQPSLQSEWKLFSEAFFPGVPEHELNEAWRTFYAGALAFDYLMVRAAQDSVGVGQGDMNEERFLRLAHALRSQLYADLLGDLKSERGTRGVDEGPRRRHGDT